MKPDFRKNRGNLIRESKALRDELNPQHPVTQDMREQWHKLCAIALFKLGKTELQITSSDITAFTNSGLANIIVHPEGDVLTLRLVSEQEASRLVREEGAKGI